MRDAARDISRLNGRYPSDLSAWTQTLCYFIFTVLGFSFWFFMAVPFASHRETYSWLATISSHGFAHAFSNSMSVTYRPLAQSVTWLAFVVLDPSTFPTSILRQALLQGFVYGMFVLAWWLIYRATTPRRLFALVAFVAGGVFFPGYVHLFHIYGIMYVPVMLTLGALLGFHATGAFDKRELWFAALATLLVFWHPFAPALFMGFYFGFYLDTFWQRSKAQHVQAILILIGGTLAIVGMGLLFARHDAATMPLHTRLSGFLISYRTNEVNLVASLVAFLLTLMVVFSMGLSRRLKLAASLVVVAFSAVFLLKTLPLLFLWVCAVLIKLFRMRSWSLFFLMLAAALLPFGGGIGTPIYALMAIIVAVYATALGWSQAEKALYFIKAPLIMGITIASLIVVLMVRAGIQVPIVTRAAGPLLTERERTYQLETILVWLHNSEYCRDKVAFAANAGSPVESLDNVITRQNRPPADIEDVNRFWNTVLRCRSADPVNNKAESAIVTFGAPALGGLTPAFKVAGRYAGEAAVWVQTESREQKYPALTAGGTNNPPSLLRK